MSDKRRRPLVLRLALVAVATLGAIGAGTAVAWSAETPERDPVVFVHGLGGSAANFDTFQSRFRSAGYPSSHLYAFSYDSRGDIVAAAQKLATEVDQVRARTGAAKVDIVTHSLGGLPSRWYVKFLGGVDKVDDWVSLGGPNLGGDPGTCPAPGSVACAQATKGSSFLAELNGGDQTPGDVSYATWASFCDSIVDRSWTPLVGATNNSAGCVSHFNLVSNTRITTAVRTTVSSG